MKKNYIVSLLLLLTFSMLVTGQTQTKNQKVVQGSVNFKVTTWNTEWLSCNQQDPADDLLQITNVASVIKTVNPDIIALQEVGTSSLYPTIDTLVRKLGSEWGGYVLPSDNSNCGQNQAIIYKKAKIQLLSSTFITNGGTSYDWSSGRYPVLYSLNFIAGNDLIPVSFINIHAKAMSDATSYSRRKNSSVALKTLLDGSSYNSNNVILIGDFNDYLTGTQCSSCSPADSPYKNFVDDLTNYKCLTQGLADPNYNSPVIDNIIISNELVDEYVSNSLKREVLAVQGISNYYTTTSDHVPVSVNFSVTTSTSNTCADLAVSETFAESLGNFSQISTSGAQVWYWRQTYGACISGYSAGTNNANEDWLVSPAYDLSGKLSANLKFNHAINYSPTESERIANHTLWVSDNFTTSLPSDATWTKLNITTMPTGTDWNYINSGTIAIPEQYLKSNVRFAFKYISGTTSASTWEIKDLTLDATCISTELNTFPTKKDSKISVVGKKIIVENNSLLTVKVYNLTGGTLFSKSGLSNTEIEIENPGIYIVRVGDEVEKVIVK